MTTSLLNPAIERAVPGLHSHMSEVVRRLAIESTSRIVDIGAGTGAFLARLKAMGFINLHGVDVTRPDSLPESIFFHTLDLDTGHIPLETASVDVITCIEVVEHVENLGNFLSELARILKPGGCALMTTPNLQSLETRVRYFLLGKLKQFDEKCDPTHISPIHLHPFRKILDRHRLQIGEYWGFPTDGSTLTSRSSVSVLGKTLRVLGMRADPPGDTLCMKLVCAGDSGRTKVDFITSAYR